MNDNSGANWRKWDLHVHTPASLKHEYKGSGDDPWIKFIDDLERLPEEFKVLGINDYFFIDGYKRLRQEKAKGRLSNIDLLVPVIEVRIDKFGGTDGNLRRLNLHILFSDQLEPETIEQQFINAIPVDYSLSPEYEGKVNWNGIVTKSGLIDLGSKIIATVPEEKRSKYGSPLEEGFNNINFSLDRITGALQSHFFKDMSLLGLGVTEWESIKWNDQSIAEKKNVINKCDFVLVAAKDVPSWKKAKQRLSMSAVNSRLLDCSDAHHYSDSSEKDRIGNCQTWIKADPTFHGLQQALKEFDRRVFVGDTPPKLKLVDRHKTKYLRSIEIRKNEGSVLDEVWFDDIINLNTNMVAIIGNRGAGKSALADVIGLMGNSRQERSFSFLTEEKFQHPKGNKAKEFTANAKWADGTTESVKGLNDGCESQQVELVKYIPQKFLDTLCNELPGKGSTVFESELKNVIFSHVEIKDRLHLDSLDELISYRTEEIQERIESLRDELGETIEKLVDLESLNTEDHKNSTENQLKQKQVELSVHRRNEPKSVSKPESVLTEEQREFENLCDLRAELLICIQMQRHQSELVSQKIASAEKVLAKIENFREYFARFEEDCEDELSYIGLNFASTVQLQVDDSKIRQALLRWRLESTAIDMMLESDLDWHTPDFSNISELEEIYQLEQSEPDWMDDPTCDDIEEDFVDEPLSLVRKLDNIDKRLEVAQSRLEEPLRRYQEYLRLYEEWKQQESSLIGSIDEPGSLKYLENALSAVAKLPEKIAEVKKKRLEITRIIHSAMQELSSVYSNLFSPVQRFIEGHPLAKGKFQMNFDVALKDIGFHQEFLEKINRGIAGSFCGADEGAKLLKKLIDKYDFEEWPATELFLDEIIDHLENDRRSRSTGRASLQAQLKRGHTVASIYQYIFSLQFLRPVYSLQLGGKDLSQLSPGEKGLLLLVFYLLIDKGDTPLIIDQPEENLDNQTVFEFLAPCMDEARQRRQIIIVTHNPNLAVACDAEQIICAEIDKGNGNSLTYLSGSIENPEINKRVVDILEGTSPAFRNRESKYRQ